jgi:hypothetical protein
MVNPFMIPVGLLDGLSLKKEAQHYSETSLTIHQSTWRNIPEDLNLPQQQHEKPTSLNEMAFQVF